MENLYFPLFLVVLAVVVIWFFARSGSRDARDRRSVRRPTGRLADVERPLSTTERPRISARPRPIQGAPVKDDIWKTKRERAAKATFSETIAEPTYRANYIGPHSGDEARPTRGDQLKDQGVSRAEHLSLDEYFSKQEKEKAEQAEKKKEESGLTMTAMKYEASDAESKSDQAPGGNAKRAGSKS